jgi:hypothetical protein
MHTLVLGGQDTADGRCGDRREREQAEPPSVQERPEDQGKRHHEIDMRSAAP